MSVWDDALTGESTAHAYCEGTANGRPLCPHFHARGKGRAEIAEVVYAADEHTKLGREHHVRVDVEL